MTQPTDDIKPNLKQAATAFIAQHLAGLCREEAEWRDTGILREGCMRQLATICAEFTGKMDALSVAQKFVQDAAIDAVARPAPDADDIKLPELPKPDNWTTGYKPEYRRQTVQDYARTAVLDDRERQRQKLPANWNHDSSLETWFPLTAETLRKLRAENVELRKDKARLDSGMIMTPERDEFGETFLCERRGMDLREAIDAAMAQEAGRDS